MAAAGTCATACWAPWLVGGIAMGLAAALAAPAALLLAQYAVLRSWDGRPRSPSYMFTTPWPVFQLLMLQRRFAAWLLSLVPAPVRVAELASSFASAQVVFALVELGVPAQLASGPKTPAQLAAACGVANVDWCERLLAAAHQLGLVGRRQVGAARAQAPVAAAPAEARRSAQPSAALLSPDRSSAAAQHMAAANPTYAYRANAMTAALRDGHDASMASFVQLLQLNAASMRCLAEGLRTDKVPFEAWSGGERFWDWLAARPDRAAMFDRAMTQQESLGAGEAVILDYRGWRRADLVIDVAGGVGGFMAQLLARLPRVKGAVVEQKGQAERGRQWWSEAHPQLLPRMRFIDGDMFDGTTIPRPAEQGTTLYLLRSILHNWDDQGALAILTAIRSRVEDAQRQQVRLVLVETALLTASEAPLAAATLAPRHTLDLTMLNNFGGKERSRAEFRPLLAASGWELVAVVPTHGVFFVLEARPC